MLIENAVSTRKYTLAFILTGVLFFVVFGFGFYDKSSMLVCSIIAFLLALAHIILAYLNPCYFYWYDDDKHEVEIRYYKAYPFFRKYTMYKIKKDLFYDYSFSKSFFNKKTSVVITLKGRDNQNKIATLKYPSISLLALEDRQIINLKYRLSKLIDANKK